MGILRSDLIAHSSLATAGASVLFDGGDGNAGSTGLKTADSGNKYVIQGDTSELTIECWIYCTSVSQTFDTIWATNNYGVSGNGASFYQHYDGVYFTISGGADLDIRGLFELNKWHHVATTRQWSPSKSTHQWRIYVDGEIVGYNETGSSITEGVLCIGANNYGSAFPAYEFAGYISNFRMCKRVLYKEKFTPSKFKLKDVPGTVLLCCQDASDDTAVTVGDTLTAGGSPTPGGFGPDLKEDNTDTGVVLADNTKFDTLSYMVPPGGRTDQRGRGRGVYAGGYVASGYLKDMYYIEIQSQGNANDFGDLNKAGNATGGGCGSATRGIHMGGTTPTSLEEIDFFTFATTSNATDFGNLAIAVGYNAALSNQTRGVCVGGRGGSPLAPTNHIQTITIASTGNATDAGDLTQQRMALGALASPTRGVIGGGYNAPASPTVNYNTIDFITLSSVGDATDFGDLVETQFFLSATSSQTRGLFSGGNNPQSVNTIQFITIASTGNSVDFGDMSDVKRLHGSVSNDIRAVFGGGMINSSPNYTNSMNFVTIATTGNGIDFGDIPRSDGFAYTAGASDSHGGIS